MASFSETNGDIDEWEASASEANLEVLQQKIVVAEVTPSPACTEVMTGADEGWHCSPDASTLCSGSQNEDEAIAHDGEQGESSGPEGDDGTDEVIDDGAGGLVTDAFEVWLAQKVFAGCDTDEDTARSVTYVCRRYPTFAALAKAYRDRQLDIPDIDIQERLEDVLANHFIQKMRRAHELKAAFSRAVPTESNRRAALAAINVTFREFVERARSEVKEWAAIPTTPVGGKNLLLEQSVNHIVRMFSPVRMRRDALQVVQSVIKYIVLAACVVGHQTMVRMFMCESYMHSLETKYLLTGSKRYHFIPADAVLVTIAESRHYEGLSTLHCPTLTEPEQYCLIEAGRPNHDHFTTYLDILCAFQHGSLAIAVVNRKLVTRRVGGKPHYSFVFSNSEVQSAANYLRNTEHRSALLQLRANCVEDQSEEQDLLDYSGDYVLR